MHIENLAAPLVRRPERVAIADWPRPPTKRQSFVDDPRRGRIVSEGRRHWDKTVDWKMQWDGWRPFPGNVAVEIKSALTPRRRELAEFVPPVISALVKRRIIGRDGAEVLRKLAIEWDETIPSGYIRVIVRAM